MEKKEKFELTARLICDTAGSFRRTAAWVRFGTAEFHFSKVPHLLVNAMVQAFYHAERRERAEGSVWRTAAWFRFRSAGFHFSFLQITDDTGQLIMQQGLGFWQQCFISPMCRTFW